MWVVVRQDPNFVMRERAMRVPGHNEVHGERLCVNHRDRFFCVLCWRLLCWCKGCASEADLLLTKIYTAVVPTKDPGFCDDCFVHMARGSALELSVHEDEEGYWSEEETVP